MPSFVQTRVAGLRRGLSWLQLRRFFAKGPVALLLLAAAVGLISLKELVPLLWQGLLWAGLLLASAWLLRGISRQLLGPVLLYDLIRSSRRGEQVGHRCLYAALLVGVLFLVYWSWFPNCGLEQLLRQQSMSVSERARFAAAFFNGFLAAQIGMVALITPLYTAGAIAEQKERRTLEFVLVTDLSNREIVLGMLGARLAKLFLLLLTGLPVITLLEFLGGVDPSLVLAGFFVTVMLMWGLGSMSISISVHSETALQAVIQSYLCMLPLVGFLTCCLTGMPFSAGPGPSVIEFWTASVVLAIFYGLIDLLCCRSAIAFIRTPIDRPTNHPDREPRVPRIAKPSGPYPIPEVELVDPGSEPYPTSDSDSWQNRATQFKAKSSRPPVGSDALLWKEMHVERTLGLSLHNLVPGGLLLVVLLLLLLVGISLAEDGHSLSEVAQGVARRVGIGCGAILLLIVALSAAGRISHERERRTLESLLALPVTTDDILFAKWLGSILSVRSLWWALAVVWALGLVTGGVHPVALPLLIAACVVYTAFLTCLGLWFSTFASSSLRANLLTLLATLLFLIVPGLLISLTDGGAPATLAPQERIQWGSLFMEYGLSPTSVLWTLTFRSADLLEGKDPLTPLLRILAAVAGLHCYLAASALLWVLTRARLDAAKGPRPGGRGLLENNPIHQPCSPAKPTSEKGTFKKPA